MSFSIKRSSRNSSKFVVVNNIDNTETKAEFAFSEGAKKLASAKTGKFSNWLEIQAPAKKTYLSKDEYIAQQIQDSYDNRGTVVESKPKPEPEPDTDTESGFEDYGLEDDSSDKVF